MKLLEAVVVLGVIVFLAAMLLPAHRGRSKTPVVLCMSHLKHTGYAFLMYEEDNRGTFPMEMPVAQGSNKDRLDNEETFRQFQKIQKYLSDPGLLLCPVDKSRLAATNYASLNDWNISYFLNLNASTNHQAQTILAGDRYLLANGEPVRPGMFTVTANVVLSWSPNYHNNKGLLAFADDHVEISTSNRLQSTISSQPLGTNRFSIP